MVTRNYKSWQLLAICLLSVAIFTLVSLSAIGKFSLWHDESFTHMLVSDTPREMIRRTSYDVHPPLYYVLLKAWASLFGYSAVALRSFSLVTMVLAISIMIAFSWRKYGRGAATISAVLLSVNPALLRYSQEMRMYGLVMLLVVASTWSFMGLINKPSWTRKAIYGCLVAGLIYTQYFAVFIVFGHILFWLYRKNTLKKLKSVGLKRTMSFLFKDKSVWPALLLSGLLFAPWLPILALQADKTQGGFWIGPATYRSIVNFLTTSFGMKPEWLIQSWSSTLLIVILALVIRLVYLASKKHKPEMEFPLFVALTPIATLYLLSMPPLQSYFHERYLLITVPYLILLGAVASVKLRGTRQKMALTMLALVFLVSLNGMRVASKLGPSFGWSNSEYFTSKSMAEWSDDKFRSGDSIVASSLWVYFDARYYQQVERGRAVLIKDTGTNKYGNNSLVYDRTDIKLSDDQIKSLSGRVWVYDESKPLLSTPNNWSRVDRYERGYGSLTLYKVN